MRGLPVAQGIRGVGALARTHAQVIERALDRLPDRPPRGDALLELARLASGLAHLGSGVGPDDH